MPQIQAEHNSEIQAFWRWHSTTRRRGIGGPNHATQCDFIPFSAVQEYLGASQRVEELLAALSAKNVDAQYVRDHYLRSLAILLLIGQGPMIEHFVRYLSLKDNRLRFRTRPEDFPHSSDSEFFDRFHKEQWQFCAVDLKYTMDLQLHKEEILPITQKEEIGRGGNANVFKIVVHREYNNLVPDRWKMPERPLRLRDTFVLKTYRGSDAKEQHKAEHDAFINLRQNNEPSPFIIAYYGSFIDDGTYNIILEYADRGNLDQFMSAVRAPSTPEDMIELWDRLCKITHGLAVIHGTSKTLLGWHQDIKPANILVVSGSGTSDYDVYFKLADLSLCHFTQDKDTDLDALGTRTYGAPETFRFFENMDPIPVQVRQNVDVWSVGCVFSEAAVWSRFGWNHLLEYRCQRQEEIKKRLGLDGERWFHDEYNVLQTVHDIHEHIARSSQSVDQVMINVLRIVSNHMLLNEHQRSASARYLHNEFLRAIDTTCNTLMIGKNSPSRNRDDVGVDSGSKERPMTPPSVPPGYIGERRNSSPMLASPVIYSPMVPRPKNLHTKVAHRQHHTKAINTNESGQSTDVPFGPFESYSNSLHDLPSPPSPASSYQLSEGDTGNEFPLNAEPTHQGMSRQSPSPHHTRTRSARSADKQALSKSPIQEQRAKPPQLALIEALLWKENRKKKLQDPLHGEENLASLNVRDHIFVVDNSQSMLLHRQNVQKVVSLLGYILKDSDPDGLDIYFTQSTGKVNSRKSTELSTAVSQARFQGVSDMRTRLSQILQVHIDKFGTTTTPSKSWYRRRSRTPEAQRPLSFYVLTDGIWQPKSEVGPVITNLVKRMGEHKLLKEHVSVQFIRFGDDPQATERLNTLDHGLGLKDIDMDIVDTTPWNGNIWKQLLGALNAWYDDDPD